MFVYCEIVSVLCLWNQFSWFGFLNTFDKTFCENGYWHFIIASYVKGEIS